MSDHLAEILLLGAHGLRAFPCWRATDGRCPCRQRTKCPSPGKHPFAVGWQQQATADPHRLRELFERFPGRNVGVATGMTSGVIVVDVDPRHGGDESLADLERAYGPMPNTWRVLTGGGGWHLYFRHPGLVGLPCNSNVVGMGIDIRGEGGLVIAPPSIHANGRPYAWDLDHHPDEEQLADLPSWIIAIIDRSHMKQARAPEEWKAIAANAVEEGRRTERLMALTGHLLRRKVDPYVILELMQAWNALRCQPPLEGANIQEIVNRLARNYARTRTAA